MNKDKKTSLFDRRNFFKRMASVLPVFAMPAFVSCVFAKEPVATNCKGTCNNACVATCRTTCGSDPCGHVCRNLCYGGCSGTASANNKKDTISKIKDSIK